jgi:hypothetical protein
MWMLLAEAAESLCAEGKRPLVLQSVQCPGAIEHNRAVLEQWERTRVPYDGEAGYSMRDDDRDA